VSLESVGRSEKVVVGVNGKRGKNPARWGMKKKKGMKERLVVETGKEGGGSQSNAGKKWECLAETLAGERGTHASSGGRQRK